MLRTFFTAIALLGALPGTGPIALAQDTGEGEATEEARAHFQRGQTAYQQGDYETAIREWDAAYEADPRPRIQFNLSQAYERLGRLQDAAAALDRYLETAEATDENQADARARRSALRERVGRTGVRITGAPDGATILVDGQDWGRAPRPDAIGLEPGTHRIVIRLEGYRDFNATVVVPAGDTVDVAAELEAAPIDEGRPATQDSGGSVWPYLFLGGAGALFVVGSLFGLGALGAADDANPDTVGGRDGPLVLAAIADISFIGAVLAGGVGLLWLLLEDGDDEEAAQPTALRLGPWVAPTGAGASAEVMF